MKYTYSLNNLCCKQTADEIVSEINIDTQIKAKIIFKTKKLYIDSKILLSKEIIENIVHNVDPNIAVFSPENECEYCNIKNQSQKRKTITKRVLPIKDIVTSSIGLIIAIAAYFIIDYNFYFGLSLYILSYLILGYEVLLEAVKNITHGGFLDENFLMAIATIGAFGIQQYPEAIGVMLFYKIGEAFEHYAVSRSRNSIMSAVDMREETVLLLDELGNQTTIPAAQAKVGQHILIKVGERIPLDGQIIKGETFLNTSPITGESVPVRVKENDLIYSGCLNTTGVIEMEIKKELSDSMVTRILKSVENASENKPRMDRFISRFSKFYTPIVVGLALIIAIVPSIISGDWAKWITSALTLLVISCPCALVLSVPLAYFSGIGRASKSGIIFKGGISLETLTKVRIVVLDKTGTLTKGDFSVQNINVFDASYTPNQILSIMGSLENNSDHPIAKSIIKNIEEKNLSTFKVNNIKEISGKGIAGEINEKTYYLGNVSFMKEKNISDIPQSTEVFGTTIYLSNEHKLIGSVEISDTLKIDAKETIDKLTKLNLKTAMLTGDTNASALAVQKETGVAEVYSELLPEDKLKILQDLRKEGPVMFVGDGINDAPVIANADCGAAMGNGTDAAIEASDVVFMNSNLSSITSAIDLSKKTQSIAMGNIIFALTFKAIILTLAFAGLTNLWVAVFADTGVAILCLLNSMRLLRYKMKK
jgi:Cd2+/Zn2+-exporting ATPase